MSDEPEIEAEIETEADETEVVWRYFHGIPVHPDAYEELFAEFDAWHEAARWPEEQERDRLGVYNELLGTLSRMLSHETGTDNGLDDVTEKSVNRTIRTVLQDLCRRISKGD